MRLALALLLLATPLLGQTPHPRVRQAIDIGPRFVRFDAPVEAISHRVRIGQNHGNAVAMAVRLESQWWRATAWWSHTQVVTDTASGDNPARDARYDDVELVGVTVGMGKRWEPVGVAVGVGGLSMTCSYARCGSSPMFGWLLSADADVCLGKGWGMRACVRGGVEAVPPREGRWTWLADRAGRDLTVPHTDDGGWWVNPYVGLSVGVQW